ncbi:MAG TPA: GGDEF domain-containing protein [Dongiaceae bacterium]|nr:GGDEF domain-containing protein [Dongiaceae bacterium]
MGAKVSARIVDLDTARLVNDSHDLYREPQALANLEALAIARLNAVLQTSIELPEILRLFFREMQRITSLDGLSYQHSANNVEHNLGNVAGHTSHYRLQTRTDYLGELSLHRMKQPFSEEELRRLDRLVTALACPLRNGLRYLEAVRASLTDGLTGAGNRISLDSVLNREVDQANRYHQPLSILVLDLDHFKKINDTYGHVTGDYVLKMVAKTIQASSRCADMTFRFGGEEFVVLLSQTDVAGAKITAERIRSNIAQLALHFSQQQIPVSVSVGLASLSHSEHKDSLLDRADRALYQAKQAGRNQVVLAEPMLACATT